MSQSARRPHPRTSTLQRLREKSRARRQESDSFFERHLAEVADRLTRATAPYDRQRAELRKARLQAAHTKELDATAGFRLGTAGRKPQLWQVEGDGCGQ